MTMSYAHAGILVRYKNETWKFVGPSEVGTTAVLSDPLRTKLINAQWEEIAPYYECAECGGFRNPKDYLCDRCRSNDRQ